jgi:putative sigma-54 modulation protein
MQIEYTGRQVTITKALRGMADEGIERIVKILGKATSAHVVLTAEKYRQMAEVTVKSRLQSILGASESTNLEIALREALEKAANQAIRYKERMRDGKRLPKEEKHPVEPELARSRRSGAAVAAAESPESKPASNGKGRSKPVVPVTVHSFPARVPIPEPHVVRSTDSIALRPMTLDEAVKEAEFRDRDVFVFRDMEGSAMVLHRKRDGKMELIEVP